MDERYAGSRSTRGAGLTAAMLVFAAACGSGDGPIGVVAIGTHESVDNSADDPHGGAAAKGSGSSPSAAPTSTSPSPGSSGSSASGLTQTCSGSFDCQGVHITLSRSAGKCTFVASGRGVLMNADHTLVDVQTGQSAGTWSGTEAGFSVTSPVDTTKVTTCTPDTGDAGS